jgi:hypothetical protein
MLEAGDNHVAQDWIKGVRISTVWLGLNHNFSLEGPPLIFETMIFSETGDLEMDEYCWRWSTEVQALAGHDQALALVRDAMARKC